MVIRKKTDTMYIWGLILTFIGALGLTYLIFFAIFILPIFIVGVFLVFLSAKPLKVKLMTTGYFVLGILIFWPIWIWMSKVEPETFLIPIDYRGKVQVLFNEAGGKNKKYENNRRLFEIPENGILISKFEDEYGIIDQYYFLIDSNGVRTELPKLDVRDFNEEWTTSKNVNESSRNELGVFHYGRVGNGEHQNEGTYYFQEFYISTYDDLINKFGHKYNSQFDSLRYELLKDSRGLD
jgi:hypothetical protein